MIWKSNHMVISYINVASYIYVVMAMRKDWTIGGRGYPHYIPSLLPI